MPLTELEHMVQMLSINGQVSVAALKREIENGFTPILFCSIGNRDKE